MNEELNSEQIFDRNIAYEGLIDSIRDEIGHHVAMMNQEDSSEADKLRHQNAARDLVEASQKIKPQDSETVEVASLILGSMRGEKPDGAKHDRVA